MSISLIEGLILMSVAGVGGIVWWGVMRLVATNDETLRTLGKINEHLALINGRLGKTEMWMELHQQNDDQQFAHTREGLARLWERVNKQR